MAEPCINQAPTEGDVQPMWKWVAFHRETGIVACELVVALKLRAPGSAGFFPFDLLLLPVGLRARKEGAQGWRAVHLHAPNERALRDIRSAEEVIDIPFSKDAKEIPFREYREEGLVPVVQWRDNVDVPVTFKVLDPVVVSNGPDPRKLAACVCLARRPVLAFLVDFLPFILLVLFLLFHDLALKAADLDARAILVVEVFVLGFLQFSLKVATGRQPWTQASVVLFVLAQLVIVTLFLKVLVFNYTGPTAVLPFGIHGPRWELHSLPAYKDLPEDMRLELEGGFDLWLMVAWVLVSVPMLVACLVYEARMHLANNKPDARLYEGRYARAREEVIRRLELRPTWTSRPADDEQQRTA
mmetsp:Transcript_26401/g.88444  ORF Transcript_26401/g.88444 Transcript_26401/m.88444 type:complete len:356 (+) Transcript_26401:356-1423(+)